VRAVLEGVAFQVRRNLLAMADLAGRPQAVIVFGGGARSALWRQILADVLGLPVGVAGTVEAAGLGAAMLAAAGGGVYPDPDSARSAMGGALEWREPQPKAAALYEGLYDDYAGEEARLLVNIAE
jgi:xylulokinase